MKRNPVAKRLVILADGSYGGVAWWLSGTALDLRFTVRGFNSRPVRFHVT